MKKQILFGKFFLSPLLLILTLFLLNSCKLNTETEADVKNRENDAEIQKYITAKGLTTLRSTTDGMYYATIGQGTRSPVAKELITLHYVISNLSDTKIDSSSTILSRPFNYVYAVNGSIFDYPVSLMKEGERGTFLVPSRLAFGSQALGSLPAYSNLKIDLKVLKIRNEEEQIEDFIALKKYDIKTIEKTSSGLRFIKTKSNPTGDAPKSTQNVKVAYTGRLLYDFLKSNTDGTRVFDSKFDEGDFEFTLGTRSAVAGFEEGVLKLKVGEKAIIIFPSFVGYAAIPKTNIPAYSPLYFEIELVGLK